MEKLLVISVVSVIHDLFPYGSKFCCKVNKLTIKKKQKTIKVALLAK